MHNKIDIQVKDQQAKSRINDNFVMLLVVEP